MQVKLRYCGECKRNTIQAEDDYADTSWVPTQIIPVWYCPNCGTQWKIERKSVNIAMSKRP